MILKGIPYLQTILTLLLCGTAFTARAQADSAEPADSCYPEIICPDSNRLGGNVAALEPLFQKLEALEKKDTTAVISILQIGDSHIQAGFFPNEVRENLQREFGNAGRGLIVPLKLAGTNEPPDYAITSPNSWNRSNCITRAATEEPGMSGMSIVTYDRHIELDIKTKEPFDRIWAFHHREAPLLKAPDSLTDDILCPLGDTEESTMIPLRETVTSVTLRSATTDTAYAQQVYYGFSLENGNRGILFHSMGINGNTFTAMNRNPQIVRQAVPLQPELIILSLGTNDSYGRNFDEAAVGAQVEKLIGLLKEYFPLCPLLLTTPMECWSRVRVKGRYVRKPNPNAERVRDQIVQAAGRHGLPVWDFYAVAGGDGAMERWYRAGLAGADRIHLSHDGYRLQGDLLCDALVKAYNGYKELHGTTGTVAGDLQLKKIGTRTAATDAAEKK